MTFVIRARTPDDAAAVAALAAAHWGGDLIVNSFGSYRASALEGFVATLDGRVVGILGYVIEDGCHIVTLASDAPGQGIGSGLLAAAEDHARKRAHARAWLVTTNDNLDALGFYQRRGYRLRELRPGAMDAARRVKPAIPLIGAHGIPLRDELVLEKPF